MKITKEWIHAHATGQGGWTRAQLKVLGVSWPPPSGWMRRVIGWEIPEEQRKAFEDARTVTAKGQRQ